MADTLNENAEFGRKNKGEEDPILVAQRFLNIYRQMHIFNTERQKQFDQMLLDMPSEIRILLSTLPGGSVLIEHIEELEQKRGLAVKPTLQAPKITTKRNVPEETKPQKNASNGHVVIDSSFASELSSSLSLALQQTERHYKEDIKTLTATLTESIMASQSAIGNMIRDILLSSRQAENFNPVVPQSVREVRTEPLQAAKPQTAERQPLRQQPSQPSPKTELSTIPTTTDSNEITAKKKKKNKHKNKNKTTPQPTDELLQDALSAITSEEEFSPVTKVLEDEDTAITSDNALANENDSFSSEDFSFPSAEQAASLLTEISDDIPTDDASFDFQPMPDMDKELENLQPSAEESDSPYQNELEQIRMALQGDEENDYQPKESVESPIEKKQPTIRSPFETTPVSSEVVSLDDISDSPVSLDVPDFETIFQEPAEKATDKTPEKMSAPQTTFAQASQTNPFSRQEHVTPEENNEDWEWEYVEDNNPEALSGNNSDDNNDWEWEYVEDDNSDSSEGDDGDWEWEYVEDDGSEQNNHT